MLKRFLFRWQKTILSLILWLCVLAVWIRSNANSGEEGGGGGGGEEELQRREGGGGHARLQRRISHLNDIVRFYHQDEEGGKDDPPPGGEFTINGFLKGSKLTQSDIIIDRKNNNNDRHSKNYDYNLNPRKLKHENPVVDIQIESNFDRNGIGGGGSSDDNLSYLEKDIDIDAGNEGEHLEIGSISQKLLSKIRQNESLKVFDNEQRNLPNRNFNSQQKQRNSDNVISSDQSRRARENESGSRMFKYNSSRRGRLPPSGVKQPEVPHPQNDILKGPQEPDQSAPTTRRCIVDGIYWTSDFLRLLPRGIETPDADRWLKSIRNSQVVKLETPKWNKCGRPKNGYAVLEDGTGVCARYRAPNTRLIQGEILSYWLARYLGFTTVPPVSLSLVNSGQWSEVSASVRDMGWDNDQFVALIMWVDNVDSSYQSKVFMPAPILNAIKMGLPVSLRRSHSDQNGCGKSSGLDPLGAVDPNHDSILLSYLEKTPRLNKHTKITVETLVQIAQWGNLIILDYITANYDRVASMQDSADKENKPSILTEPIRNLHKSKESPLLWLLDNESGLLDGYELMYMGGKAGFRFYSFHRTMLRTLCVFDKNVIEKIRDIYGFEKPDVALEELALEEEPSLSYIKPDSSHGIFEIHFKERLKDVLDWVDECELRLA